MAGFTISIAGDSAINLEFGNTISRETSGLIRAATHMLEESPIHGIRELVPTFCSLMVVYDPCVIGYDELCAALNTKLGGLQALAGAARRIVKLPVCYGAEFGPDLNYVAEYTHLSPAEVIALHSERNYTIDMLGFLPGFAYLGGLDERLHTPRLEVPRTRLEAGSVGIGGAQTGVYPLPSPGGWRIIGRTPVRPYDPDREPPILYEAGDYLRFCPITPEEYNDIEAQVAAGRYVCETTHEASQNLCASQENANVGNTNNAQEDGLCTPQNNPNIESRNTAQEVRC